MKITSKFKLHLELAVLLISLQLFSGCATPPLVYHDPNKQPQNVIVKSPEIGQIAKAEIGENMYSKSNLFYDNTKEVIIFDDIIGTYDAFRKINILSTSNPTKGALMKWGNDENTLCFQSGLCITDMLNKGYFTHLGHVGNRTFISALEKPTQYKITDAPPFFIKDSFKYIVLYQGKSDNKIKISFREFVDNVARPAFTQDVDYELEKDGTALIGFKGLRIQVLKVTNLDITYKVIQDYN